MALFSIFDGSFSIIERLAIFQTTVTGATRVRLGVPSSVLDEDNANAFTLLDWKSGLDRFRGRDQELEGLLAWATSSKVMRVKVVTGVGGVGKSAIAGRLALDLQRQGWEAGSAHLDKPEAYEVGRRGTLFIIDYPEEQLDLVEKLLTDLAQQQESRLREKGKAWRVLLLTRRHADDWQGVFDRAGATRLKDAPLVLEPPNESDLFAIFDAAHEHANRLFRAGATPVAVSRFETWLTEAPENRLPLFVVAAAVHDVFGFVGEFQEGAVSDTRRLGCRGWEVVDALARREGHRLERLSTPIGEHTLPLLLSYAALCDGLTRSQLDELAGSRLPPRIDRVEEVVKRLLQCGYWHDDAVPVLRPDVLAACFVVRTLRGQARIQSGLPAEILAWSLFHVYERKGLVPLERLMHDSETVLGMGEQGESVLSEWLEGFVNRAIAADAFEVLDQLDRFSLQEPTLGFQEAVIKAREYLVTHARDDNSKAHYLNNLSNDYAAAGRHAEAMEAIREAVEIYRRLAASSPARYEPDLATGRNNLSTCLSATGDRQGALDASREAVEIRRRLAASSPARYEPDLASSLNNLSNRLSASGEQQGALDAIREAVEIYRRLAASSPARYEPDLAVSLNNLSNRLSASGEQQGALDAIREAVEIYRRLAASSPARYEPDLAGSLNNLSVDLSATGDRQGALDASREAVEIRRRLAASSPARYEPDLASSLNNLSNRLSATVDRQGALDAIREAVEIRRRLAASSPARYEPGLATSLNNLSNRLSDSGDRQGALDAIREAVETYRRLAASSPARYEPDLASSLNNLSNRLSATGDRQGALDAIREAVEILRRLAARRARRATSPIWRRA